MADKARVWASVLVDGVPVCRIKDYERDEDIPKDSADYRIFQWALWRHGEPPQTTGHSKGGCYAEKPCDKCQKAAVKFWNTWQQRTDERWFTPAHLAAREKWQKTQDGSGFSWSAADWGERQKTLPQGFDAARAGGFPLVCEKDGHGHVFQWREVAP